MFLYSEDSYQLPVRWRVKKNPVFRLLDNIQWVDNFFSYGEIQLSCFAKFRQHPNEAQGDIREGNALCYFEDKKGNTIGIQYESGLNSLVLSTTEQLTDRVISDFKAVGAIKILDTTNFALEISKKLNFCFGGLEGRCQYEDGRAYLLKNYKQLADLYKKHGEINSTEFKYMLQSMTNEYEVFLKTKAYEYQNEYRLAWHTNEVVISNLIIRCPEAKVYCEKVVF